MAINDDLEIIANGRYGKDVRRAIHDAISYINDHSTTDDKVDKVNPETSGTFTHTGEFELVGEKNINVGSAIAQNTEDIESLKKKPSGITLTSASPLENSAAAGIAGLSAKGNSTQAEGTPTPTNPIAIVDASGVVEAHTINLLDESKVILGKSWDKNNNAQRGIVDIPISSGTYTISAITDGLSALNVCYMTSDTTATKTDNIIGLGKNPYTFTIPSGTAFIRILYVSSSTLTIDIVKGAKVQVEEGTTASEYVEYKTNEINLSSIGIDLRSIPNTNIADTLTVKPDGSAEWVQNAKKSVVDGSFDIYVSSWANQTNTVCVYWTNDGLNPDYQGVYAMADKLPAVSRNYGANNDAEMVCMSGGSAPYSTAIRILKSRIEGWSDGDTQAVKASKVKAWLTRNPITIYYPLATPIVHQLTKDQVAAILALQTYAGTTIVDSELDEVVVDYITNTKDYVDQRTNIESIVEKELRTYNWEYGMAIDTRSGSIQTVIPRGFAFGENLQYKGLMIGEDGREKALKSLQVSFDIFESKMNVSWELPTNPYEGEGVTLKIIFYWETTSARAMPVAAMLNVEEEASDE